MSIDAVALLPSVLGRPVSTAEGDWAEGPGPGGGRAAWRPLADGTLVNLGMSFQSPDGELHEAARRWIGRAPERIWVFPDTAVPEFNTTRQIEAATCGAGRWVRAASSKPSLLEDLGFTRAEAGRWQRELASGNQGRVAAALEALDRRLVGRDPKEVEALVQALTSAR